jgi:hypothetical protein
MIIRYSTYTILTSLRSRRYLSEEATDPPTGGELGSACVPSLRQAGKPIFNSGLQQIASSSPQ